MEYRVLFDGNNKYYPQKRKLWQLRWKYYGNKKYGYNAKEAWKIMTVEEGSQK